MRAFLGALVLLTCGATIALAQEPAEERLAREATNQSVEADRLFNLGDHAGALPLYRAERESRAKLGDLRYEAYAHRAIGCCLAALGETEEAIVAFNAARVLDIKRDDPGFAGYDDLLISRTQARLGRDQDAIRSAESALARLKGVADRDHELEARLLIIQASIRLDRAGDSEPHLERVKALCETLEVPALRGETEITLGLLDVSQGRFGMAFERMSDALATFRDAEMKAESLKAERYVAERLVDLGRLEAAEAGFDRLAEAYAESGEIQAGAENLLSLASIRLDLKTPRTALDAARRARAAFQSLGSLLDETAALVIEGQALEAEGDRPGAYAAILETIPIADRIQADHPEESVRLYLLAAELASRLKKPEDVDRHLSRAEQAANASKDQELREVVKAQREGLARKAKP